MSDFAFDDRDAGPPQRRRNASLGSAEAEEIFMSFDTRIVRRFSAFLRPHPWYLVGAVAAAVVSAIAQLVQPLMIGQAITVATSGKGVVPVHIWAPSFVGAAGYFTLNKIDVVCLEFAASFVVFTITSLISQSMSTRLAQKVIFDLRRAMFEHFQTIALTYMDKTHVGRVMSRLQGDVNALQDFLESTTSSISDVITLIGIAIMLLVMNWKLGLLTMLVLPALIGIRAIWLPFSKKTFRAARDASSIANGALAENINGIRTVQETRREAMNFELYEEKARDFLKTSVDSAGIAALMTPTVSILTGFAMAVIIVIGGNEVVGGALQIGLMIAYVTYVQRFFEPVRMLSMQYTAFQRAMAAGYRVFEVLDVPVTITDKPKAVVLGPDVEPTVELDHVTFGYDPERPVLKDVSIKVKPRQVVALVGPTGSGKTSIISLVRRFYEVNEGSVRVGGYDVRDVTLESLGQTIGMVLQEPFLFTGTIEDNIRYASGATHEQVVAAAKAVRAHDFIMRLPQGYDTPLGQRGRNISLGQRQLLSFARALVIDPKILILDEATANIDSFTELEIQRALRVLMSGRTCLVIAHRLATVRDADEIIVLQAGRIVEQGPHETLIAKGGLYSKLYASSHGSFDDLPGEGEDRADKMVTMT
ncbi:MAG: ABC transporter ATP-binding protein [Stellaceae bacterium]|jgi:ATP-binding cassette subfamily B protein